MPTFSHEEDPAIRSQQFVCLSFLNPTLNYQKFCEERIQEFMVYMTKDNVSTNTTEEFRNYLTDYYTNLSDLQKSHPAVKIRGVYASQEEATERVNKLSKMFKHTEPVEIYVSEVGKWVPFITKDLLSQPDISERANYTMYEYLESLENNRVAFENRMNDVRKSEKFSKRPDEVNDPDAPEFTEVQETPMVYTKKEYDHNKDYLLEDQVIPQQLYVCISFNENPTEFTKTLIDDCVKRFNYSYLHEYHQDTRDIQEIHDAFTNYISEHGPYTLPVESNIPLLKIRGAQMTEEESNERSKLLQAQDPTVDVLVANLGFWLPFAPRGEIDTKYSNTHLNAVNDKFKAARMHTELGKAKMRELKFNPDDVTTDITNDGVVPRNKEQPSLMEVLNMDEDATEL